MKKIFRMPTPVKITGRTSKKMKMESLSPLL